MVLRLMERILAIYFFDLPTCNSCDNHRICNIVSVIVHNKLICQQFTMCYKSAIRGGSLSVRRAGGVNYFLPSSNGSLSI